MTIKQLAIRLGLLSIAAACGVTRDSLGVISATPSDSSIDATARSRADAGRDAADAELDTVTSTEAGASNAVGTGSGLPPAASGIPVSIDRTGPDNSAGLSSSEVENIMAGGPSGRIKWLYPYEGTVFPRGMIAPLVMWDGPAADVVYVHMKAKSFEYKDILTVAQGSAMTGAQLQIPQDVWDKAGQQTQGKTDPFSLELTARAGGKIAGPIALHFTIAQGTVKGSIYYNSYESRLPGSTEGGAVLRVPPGGSAEVFLSGTCKGCHSVAANGSQLIAAIWVDGSGWSGASYPLVSGAAPNPMSTLVGPSAAFGALYPDGSKFLTNSMAIEVASASGYHGPNAPVDATLYDTVTGQIVRDTAIPPGALMPTFSPDGRYLVFNDYAIHNAHGLAVMDYDCRLHKASSYRVLTEEADGNIRPGWPFFLPDARGVVFVRAEGNFSGGGSLSAGLGLAPASDLYIAELATGTVTILAQAMGYRSAADAASNTTYLPFGTDELHHNYFPTVSPVAAGGYFWVFFDSFRNYGNFGVQRALWGTAIDIAADGRYEVDPSHPAFYLPGQEFNTGNHRAFTALDPCRMHGQSCTSGIDCCGGFCSTPLDEAPDPTERVGTCSPEMTACARADERCTSAAECCDAGSHCINGFCAFVPVL